MIKYCKAYKLEDLRKFNAWVEVSQRNGPDMADDALAFVWENLTVTKGCFGEADYLIETVTPEWAAFCQHDLQFAIPEDLQRAQETVHDRVGENPSTSQ